MTSNATGVDEVDGRPTILLLSLETESWFDEMYANLVSALVSKARVQRVKKKDLALRHLSEHKPSTVILTDPALANHGKKYATLIAKLVNYVNDGGTLICAAMFSSFLQMDKFRPFFEKFGLSWDSGSYQRDTAWLNHRVREVPKQSLPPWYSQKAVFLRHVAPDAVLYMPNEESDDSPADNVGDPKETPVAFQAVGAGWLGYVGDVNGETESAETIVTALAKKET